MKVLRAVTLLLFIPRIGQFSRNPYLSLKVCGILDKDRVPLYSCRLDTWKLSVTCSRKEVKPFPMVWVV